MRIAVIGASGRLGTEVVRQALGAGDDVVALAPDPARVAFAHPQLSTLPGDVHALDTVRAGLSGVDAVASVFGPSDRPWPGHYSDGLANVLQAMDENGVRRLVAVSLVGAALRDDANLTFPLRLRLLVGGATRACYDDLAVMEHAIMASGVTWTIVRVVGVADGPRTGRFRTDLEGRAMPKGREISRADLAAFMLKALASDRYARRAVSIAGGGESRIPSSSI